MQLGGGIVNIKELYEEACKRTNYKELMEDWICIFYDLLLEVKSDNPKLEKMVCNDLYISLCMFFIYYLFLIVFFLFSIITTLVIYIIKIKRNHATVASNERD